MTIGIGSGSTVVYAVEALGKNYKAIKIYKCDEFS